MISRRASLPPLLSCGIFLGLALAAGAARGDAMQAWSGASAMAGSKDYAGSLATSSNQTGPTASATDRWSRSTGFTPATMWGPGSVFPFTGRGHSFDASGTASARAGGAAESLLAVDARTSPGSAPGLGISLSGGSSIASAGWADDVIRISPASGGAMPGTIRVDLALEFGPSMGIDSQYYQGHGSGTFVARANEKEISVQHPLDISPAYAQTLFDSITTGERWVGKFHVDLAVDASGMSDTLSLMLTSSSPSWGSNTSTGGAWHNETLGITGVSFADGTSLAEKGYGVSFASSLVVPGTVPEPASVAVWSVATLVGLWAAGRGRSGVGRRG
ncbi:hypothetical protein TA3x_000093 [Tundrisphaera sp. TA3]|uniref:hypothetical protein n=1 Tax=Tundrisphaera sp. TA3 TaxID=3435775 RepID=UPI003EBACECF